MLREWLLSSFRRFLLLGTYWLPTGILPAVSRLEPAGYRLTAGWLPAGCRLRAGSLPAVSRLQPAVRRESNILPAVSRLQPEKNSKLQLAATGWLPAGYRLSAGWSQKFFSQLLKTLTGWLPAVSRLAPAGYRLTTGWIIQPVPAGSQPVDYRL